MSQIKIFGNTGRRNPSSAQSQTATAFNWAKFTTVLLLVIVMLEGLYFTCVYTDNAFVAKWRNIYIQTAMSTMNHQWLAKFFIPQDVISDVMVAVEDSQEAQVGVNSSWKDVPTTEKTPTVPAPESFSQEQIDFYQLFWELDVDSMEDYIETNPETLAKGWGEIYINEAGLDDDGTEIYTTMGEQVLAIDAKNQVLVLRVEGSGYRGVLSVAKDPTKISVQNSASIGSSGQLAGTIAENNNGILSMTASGFIDNEGKGNGGLLAGYAMSDGDGRGSHMGWSYKRLEWRDDNRMYIVDTDQSVHASTTDAVEFTPALIVDGKVIVDENSGWTALNPRAAIGQSQQGEVLMLVIEGRLLDSLGTDVIECAKILARHNAVQAMNLDGGTSAIMWFDGEYVTRCSNTACPQGRTLPNVFVYEKAQ